MNRISAASFDAPNPAMTARWHAVRGAEGPRFPWPAGSAYLVKPEIKAGRISRAALPPARALLLLGNSVTTDHISPVGRIAQHSPAGEFLASCGVSPSAFNTYGARRGNAAVMRLGTFANPRLKNLMSQSQGWFTRHQPSGEEMTIAAAASRYEEADTPLVIVAGENYGTGSARDWAAKGTAALGVRAVLAKSFERIHRTNLALVGVMPLEWLDGPPEFDGSELFSIAAEAAEVSPGMNLQLDISRGEKALGQYRVKCRLDTETELQCWRGGGFLAGRLRAISESPMLKQAI